MYIINQWKTSFISSTYICEINITEGKNGVGAAVFAGFANGKSGICIGRYNSKADAQYVLSQLYEACASDTAYEMPESYEIPDLRIKGGYSKSTSMKVNHGRS